MKHRWNTEDDLQNLDKFSRELGFNFSIEICDHPELLPGSGRRTKFVVMAENGRPLNWPLKLGLTFESAKRNLYLERKYADRFTDALPPLKYYECGDCFRIRKLPAPTSRELRNGRRICGKCDTRRWEREREHWRI